MNWWKRLTLCSAEGSICQASGALVAVADVVDCKTFTPRVLSPSIGGVCLPCAQLLKVAPAFLLRLTVTIDE